MIKKETIITVSGNWLSLFCLNSDHEELFSGAECSKNGTKENEQIRKIINDPAFLLFLMGKPEIIDDMSLALTVKKIV